MLVVGPNGAGKTNLLEARARGHAGVLAADAHGRGGDPLRCRRRPDRARGERATRALEIEVTLRLRRGQAGEAERRAASRCRAAARGGGRRSSSHPTGSRSSRAGPAVRRAYFDRALGRLWPARAALSAEYARGCRASGTRAPAGRRRSLVARRARAVDRAASPSSGRELVEARRELIADSGRGFARLRGRARAAGPRACATKASRRRTEALEAAAGARPRARRDGPRARTSTTSRSLRGRRELRGFGSQGEQRLAVLALLLGEAELLASGRGVAAAPAARRRAVGARRAPAPQLLAERVAGRARRCVTATSAGGASRRSRTQLVRGRAGRARRAAVMERIGDDVRLEPARFGPAERDGGHRAPPGRAAVGDDDRRERVAGAARARRDAARRAQLVGLGVRADAARAASSRAASARRSEDRAEAAPVRARAAPGARAEVAAECGRAPPDPIRRAASRRPPRSRAEIATRSLRELVARAAAASLRKRRSDRSLW